MAYEHTETCNGLFDGHQYSTEICLIWLENAENSMQRLFSWNTSTTCPPFLYK